MLTDAQAAEVERCLTPNLMCDPNGSPALGNAYQVTSLYFDTPELHTYHRQGNYRLQKFRIRRYGGSSEVFLERKAKRGLQVKKLRTAVGVDELAKLVDNAPEMHPAEWFLTQVAEQSIRPTCCVTYERLALVGANAHGPIRVTFDRQIRGVTERQWRINPLADGSSLLTGEVIVEFKFLVVLPTVFKQAIELIQANPAAVSKYRRCVVVTGLAPPELLALQPAPTT